MKGLKVFLARVALVVVATLTVWAATFGKASEPSPIPLYAELIGSAIIAALIGLFVWVIGRLIIVAFKIDF